MNESIRPIFPSGLRKVIFFARFKASSAETRCIIFRESCLRHCKMKAFSKHPRVIAHKHVELAPLLDGLPVSRLEDDFAKYLECHDAIGDQSRRRDNVTKFRPVQ